MKSNTFSIIGGVPVLNGVPVKRVLECKTEITPFSTTVNMKFEVMPQCYSVVPRNDHTFDFGFALKALKQGYKVTRKGWNGKNMWLRIVKPETTVFDNGMENLPYIEMKTVDDKLVPWLANQTDMLAEDWQILE